jgi:FkbM family methyltransferase
MSVRRVLGKWAWSQIGRFATAPVYRRLPFGCDLFQDVRECARAFVPGIVFDVGANVGQSALLYLEQWPDAQVHCFEPVRSTYQELSATLAGRSNARFHQLALAAHAGSGSMSLGERSVMATLSGDADEGEASREAVRMETLDGFCEREGIERISLLKIDTEGADLDVLVGGERMLTAGAVDLIQVEAGMHPENDRHVPFERLKSHLEGRGYRLFAIYEQFLERASNQPRLRRTNPVFISAGLARACAAYSWTQRPVEMVR